MVKKSKKLMMLKRFGHCVSCKYSSFLVYSDGFIDEVGFCARHNDSYCFAYDSACSHYVPFNDVMPPHKLSFYWVEHIEENEDHVPF